jgi:hypothetical protein
MSQNIEQIYVANPITTNASTDLMYFGQSPYGAGNDAAMTFANFNAQIVASGSANQIGYYATSGNKISALTGANNGVLITSNAGVPSWLANSGTPGFVLTANSGAPPSWQAVSASGAITTIDGDSGSATPLSGILTISGASTGLTFAGASHTVSLGGTLNVGHGGTGLATLTTYTLLAGGTTATGNLQQVTAGTSGQLLQSNGAGVLPTWTTATFPSGSGTLNHMLRSDGTNWVQTTAMTVDASDNLAGLATVTASGLITSTAGNITAPLGFLGSGSAAGGIAGNFAMYSPTAARGTFQFLAANNASGYDIIVTNASYGQSTTLTIPDVGASTATFLLSASLAGLQTITNGSLRVSNGGFSSGSPTGGAAGEFTGYSPTSGKGYLELLTIDGANSNGTSISNAASLGQSQVVTIPDVGASTANFLMTKSGTGVSINYQLTATALVASAGNITALAGNALVANSTTAAKGLFGIQCLDNAGNFANVLTNVSTTAARTWSMPDASGTVALAGSSVVSIQGTANEVLVNGTSGSPVTGTAITLTTPQPIGTTSDVVFNSISGVLGGIFTGNTAANYIGSLSPSAGLGSLILSAANSAGNFNGFIKNASLSAQRTWTLPDTSGTIALVSGSVGFTYNSVSGTSQAAVAGNAYLLNNAAATTVTLPASGSSTIGDTIKVKGASSAPFIIQANTSQVINDGSVSSSSAGTATSAAGTDSIQLVYVASNTWSVDWTLSSGFVLA